MLMWPPSLEAVRAKHGELAEMLLSELLRVGSEQLHTVLYRVARSGCAELSSVQLV